MKQQADTPFFATEAAASEEEISELTTKLLETMPLEKRLRLTNTKLENAETKLMKANLSLAAFDIMMDKAMEQCK